MDVADEAGKTTGYIIQVPGQKPHYQPAGQTKTSPMDALRERQQGKDGGGKDKKAPQYKSKDDVVKAFKDGKLSRDEAAKILNTDFGVPLK